MSRSKELRANVEAYVRGWREADRDAWRALFAEDARIEDPVGKPPMVGRDACVAFFDGVQAMPMTFSPIVERIAVCGNEAMLSFTMQTRAENGSGMDLQVVDIFTFNDDNKIVSLKAYWDRRCQIPVPPSA